MSASNGIRKSTIARDYGAWWATKKKLRGADEMARILILVRPDPPMESKESSEELRRKLLKNVLGDNSKKQSIKGEAQGLPSEEIEHRLP